MAYASPRRPRRGCRQDTSFHGEKKMFSGLVPSSGGNMAVAASGQGGLLVESIPRVSRNRSYHTRQSGRDARAQMPAGCESTPTTRDESRAQCGCAARRSRVLCRQEPRRRRASDSLRGGVPLRRASARKRPPRPARTSLGVDRSQPYVKPVEAHVRLIPWRSFSARRRPARRHSWEPEAHCRAVG